MDIGAIGGAMTMGGMGAMMPAGAAALNPAGLSSGISGAGPAGMSGMNGLAGAGLTPQMQNLVNMMHDFSSAEILLALMMMSAGDKDEKKCGGGAALGMLLGMSLAAQVGQMFGNMANGLSGMAGLCNIGTPGLAGSVVNFQA